MVLSAVNSGFDIRAARMIARHPDVIRAARESGLTPLDYVKRTVSEGGGLSGLGFSLSDTANQVMQLYTQYKAANAPAPAPVAYQAPAAPAAQPRVIPPWYKSMIVLVPVVAGIGILAALIIKKRRK